MAAMLRPLDHDDKDGVRAADTTVWRRRLVRRSFAHGLLNSYALIEAEPGGGKRPAA